MGAAARFLYHYVRYRRGHAALPDVDNLAAYAACRRYTPCGGHMHFMMRLSKNI